MPFPLQHNLSLTTTGFPIGHHLSYAPRSFIFPPPLFPSRLRFVQIFLIPLAFPFPNSPIMPRVFGCTEITQECTIENTIYGYYPDLGANILFAALFGICCIAQLVLGIRTRSWVFMGVMVLGAFAEGLGRSSSRTIRWRFSPKHRIHRTGIASL